MRLKVVMELLNLILNSSRFSDLGILEQSCTKLTKQLGKWHDLEMLLRSLREFRLESFDEISSKKVKKALKLVRRDSARHKKKILKSLVKELP